ncbi:MULTISPECIES: sulfurtransferase TusA family protein [unclassified Acinetobacter]|jgi:tRNA 2-thiouridine synthesizing protein A|uniref:sulfurtransferase TusA family protein n=1 Tax=Acinetobacter TaxID=469 RepID=UPI0018AAA75E|nr:MULTISPECIES: sulfurtransferase TusA family protein [unclassified Acinetobacter]MBJ9952120.1 sulfurtransferase TusA family protein [Acinetobacter baumannii]
MNKTLGQTPIDTNPTEIDSMGKPCPMPLLMLKRELKKAVPQQMFLLKSSDPHSKIDISRYCEMHQLDCQLTQVSEHEFHYLIES